MNKEKAYRAANAAEEIRKPLGGEVHQTIKMIRRQGNLPLFACEADFAAARNDAGRAGRGL